MNRRRVWWSVLGLSLSVGLVGCGAAAPTAGGTPTTSPGIPFLNGEAPRVERDSHSLEGPTSMHTLVNMPRNQDNEDDGNTEFTGDGSNYNSSTDDYDYRPPREDEEEPQITDPRAASNF